MRGRQPFRFGGSVLRCELLALFSRLFILHSRLALHSSDPSDRAPSAPACLLRCLGGRKVGLELVHAIFAVLCILLQSRL
jgi:hypothetical protein